MGVVMQSSLQSNNVRPMPEPIFGQRYATVSRIDVAVIGGDLLFREGLKRLFTDTPVHVSAEAESAQAAGLDPEAAPDVVILLNAPACGSAPAEIRQIWPKVRIVVLARQIDGDILASAIQAGIDGCLLTDMSPAALVQALNLVKLGENLFPTRLAAALTRSRGEPEGAGGRPVNLTGREIDILRGLLDGHSNKMIANRLGTTDATVKAQLRHLLRKIGAENRTQAALWAREHGIHSEEGRDAP